MQDSELKKHLLETCPVRPGQEARAWSALRDRLYNTNPVDSRWAWLSFLTWRKMTGGGLAAACVLAFVGNSLIGHYQPVSFASADSEAPGIYATSFYSSSAQAQVVWLDGLEPATDQPTYLDPTSVISSKRESHQPAGDPNSL